MTAIRRQIILRIHRETGKNLLELLRNSRDLDARQIAQRYVRRTPSLMPM